VAWFRRRDEWFAEETRRHGVVRCVVCRRAGTARKLELHHMDYAGVVEHEDGTWTAGERHEDLVAAHPRCHEWIHSLLDRDPAASAASTRRAANERVISRLRHKFATQISGWGRRER
jgi:hypothetical protein